MYPSVVLKITRRNLLSSSMTGLAFAASPGALWAGGQTAAQSQTAVQSQTAGQSVDQPAARKNRIHQSAARWCYKDIPLDQLCAYGAHIGLRAIDLLDPVDFEVPRQYGLVCSMGYTGKNSNIKKGLNRVANHDGIEQDFRQTIPLAVKAQVPNLITFSGNREGLSDEEGAVNTVAGLNRLKKLAEDSGVTICMELLNSKINHPDYMCDHTAWGVRVVEEVNSPHVKLLYDIYHMQIMEGDLIDTIRKNIQWIGHFHTGGVPGRHELNDQQEVQWDGVMRGIVSAGYSGYVAHEFVPTGDPRESLRQAVDLCDV